MDNKLNGALSSIKKNPFFIGLFVIVLGVVVFVSFTLAKAMNNKIEELEALVAESEQVSFDENELAVSELKEELEKAQVRIKYLEGKLGFGFTQNGKN